MRTRLSTLVRTKFLKAFDCLDIPIMLNSLHQSGIRGKALKWIESWCRGNKFRVKVEGKLSKEKDITSGSKQGSSMGTGLFNVYVNDLLKELERETPSNILVFAYADDIIIIQACELGRNNNDEMQQLLKRCSDWSEKQNYYSTSRSHTFCTLGDRVSKVNIS